MSKDLVRDISSLTRGDMLDDYVRRAKNRRGALTSSTLRMRSVAMRDIFVHAAITKDITSEGLKHLLQSGIDIQSQVKDTGALAELGNTVLLQNLLEDDVAYGKHLLAIAEEGVSGVTASHLRTWTQQCLAEGDPSGATRLLEKYPELKNEFFGYLAAELNNPFTHGSATTFAHWMEQFNRVFEHYHLAPVDLVGTHREDPFDRLTTHGSPKSPSGIATEQLVSVIITTYQPNQEEITTAVRSILNQTWANIELIIVNDGSGAEYDSLLNEIDSLDSRIRLLNLPRNQGTYAARNAGYESARGEFLTGQDDDDWSHPERIARQVEYLRNHPDAIGCRADAIRCDANLSRVRVGYHPKTENASSLLIRREGYKLAGRFLQARKAADTEFYYRLMRVSDRPIGSLKEPLSIIRIRPSSLSRSDFAPGWRHSARRSFRSSYEVWHQTADKSELTLGPKTEAQVKIPERFQTNAHPYKKRKLDVVFAGDWHQNGGPQKSMLEEIRALLLANYRVGILNMPVAWFMAKEGPTELNREIQLLINRGIVDEIHYDDAVEVQLLILRYPPILQFLPYGSSTIKVHRMLILANQAPSERDGRSIRYLVPECHSNAQIAFKTTPLWAPQGPHVREFLQYYLTENELTEFDLPGILNLKDWWRDRLWYRSSIPVVGRHSRDHVMKWPSDRHALKQVYPLDGRFDVRIMGGASVPARILGSKYLSHYWIVYERDEIPVRDFLYSLDYFVFYQHPYAVEAFGRAILEAIASGVVAILPPHFEPVFGEAALYCEPDEVPELIATLHSNFSNYRHQLVRAKRWVLQYFSYESFQDRISSILNKDSRDYRCI